MYSDKTLKESIGDIQDTKTLLLLRPRQFLMKGGKRLQYGFIAQEIEETPYNNLVYSNTGGIKSVAYTQLIAVLTSHIIDLTKRVEDLEKQLNTSKNGRNL